MKFRGYLKLLPVDRIGLISLWWISAGAMFAWWAGQRYIWDGVWWLFRLLLTFLMWQMLSRDTCDLPEIPLLAEFEWRPPLFVLLSSFLGIFEFFFDVFLRKVGSWLLDLWKCWGPIIGSCSSRWSTWGASYMLMSRERVGSMVVIAELIGMPDKWTWFLTG